MGLLQGPRLMAWTTKSPIWGNHWVPLGCRALLGSVNSFSNFPVNDLERCKPFNGALELLDYEVPKHRWAKSNLEMSRMGSKLLKVA